MATATINSIKGTNPVSPQAPAVIQSVSVSAPAIKKFRLLGQGAANFGNTSQIPLLVGYKIRTLWLQITGTVTYSGTGSATLTAYQLYDAIQNLQLQVPGGTTLFNISGKRLFWLNYFRDAYAPSNVIDSIIPGTAPFNVNFSGLIRLDLAMLDQINRVQTSLNAKDFGANGLNLYINWAPVTTFAQGPTSPTATSATANVTVYSDENIGGLTPNNIIEYSTKILGPLSAGSNWSFNINPASNKSIRALLLRGYNPG